MDAPKIRTVFLLNADLHEQLEKVSEERGAPVSELLRRATAVWLSQQQESGFKPQGQSA